MQEVNPLRIGDRVTVNGHDAVFFVVDVDHQAQTASLLPTDSGRILDKISWETLKFYRGFSSDR